MSELARLRDRARWLEAEIRHERKWIRNLQDAEAMPSLIGEHHARLAELEGKLAPVEARIAAAPGSRP